MMIFDRFIKLLKSVDGLIYVFSIVNYYLNKLKYKSVSHPNKILWVNPHHINYNLKSSPKREKTLHRGAIINGDWDFLVKCFNTHKKHLSMKQRFIDGVKWHETIIFKKNYKIKLEKGKTARGYSNLQDLINYYQDKVEWLYEEIKNNGFKTPESKLSKNDVYVYIDRNGELLLGSNGNHRLSLAKIIGLKKIPVRVHIRHKEWQETRDKTYKLIKSGNINNKDLLDHPDLQDLYV